MRNLMFQDFIESLERSKDSLVEFDFVLCYASKTEVFFSLHPFDFEMRHSPLFQGHADVLSDF